MKRHSAAPTEARHRTLQMAMGSGNTPLPACQPRGPSISAIADMPERTSRTRAIASGPAFATPQARRDQAASASVGEITVNRGLSVDTRVPRGIANSPRVDSRKAYLLAATYLGLTHRPILTSADKHPSPQRLNQNPV